MRTFQKVEKVLVKSGETYIVPSVGTLLPSKPTPLPPLGVFVAVNQLVLPTTRSRQTSNREAVPRQGPQGPYQQETGLPSQNLWLPITG
jgi:hypothetical protein